MVQARFDDPMWEDFVQLSARMKEVFEVLVTMHSTSLVDMQDTASRVFGTATAAFVCLVFFCDVVYYRSIIHSLNRSIKGNRALLLLLPEDVVHNVNVLRDTMATLTKKLM